jgi:hypothetical protein
MVPPACPAAADCGGARAHGGRPDGPADDRGCKDGGGAIQAAHCGLHYGTVQVRVNSEPSSL